MPAPTPVIPERVLTATSGSPMRFMHEYVIWDSEMESHVRFRAPFVMPNWDGVTDNEDDYIIENTWIRIDILAKRAYGSEELGWVISARNDLDLPDVQLYLGRRIKIPRRDWVERKLLTQGM